MVFLQLGKIFLLEVFPPVFGILSSFIPPLLREPGYFLPDVFHAVIESKFLLLHFALLSFIFLFLLLVLCFKIEFFIDIDLRTDEDGVILPHPDHILRIAAEVEQGLCESCKRTFQPLYEQDLHDGGELLCHIAYAAVAPSGVFLFVGRVGKVLDGTVTEISQPFISLQLFLLGRGDDGHGVREKRCQFLVHDVFKVVRSDNLREYQALRFYVFFIIRLDVGSCPALKDVAQNAVAEFPGDLVKPSAAFV